MKRKRQTTQLAKNKQDLKKKPFSPTIFIGSIGKAEEEKLDSEKNIFFCNFFQQLTSTRHKSSKQY